MMKNARGGHQPVPPAKLTSPVPKIIGLKAAAASGSGSSSPTKISPRPPVVNPKAKAVGGLLQPLNHVAEIKQQPTTQFTPRDPLLRALENGPAMPTYQPDEPQPLNLPEVSRLQFEGGEINEDLSRPYQIPDVNRPQFEGGLINEHPSSSSAHHLHPPQPPREPHDHPEGGRLLPNGRVKRTSLMHDAEESKEFQNELNSTSGLSTTDENEPTLPPLDIQSLDNSASTGDSNPEYPSLDANNPAASPTSSSYPSLDANHPSNSPTAASVSYPSLDAPALISATEAVQVIFDSAIATLAEHASARATERANQLAAEIEEMKRQKQLEREAMWQAELAESEKRQQKQAEIDAAVEAERQRLQSVADAKLEAERQERARIAAEEEAAHAEKLRLESEAEAAAMAALDAELAAIAAKKLIEAEEAARRAKEEEQARLEEELTRLRLIREQREQAEAERRRLEDELNAQEAARLLALQEKHDRLAREQAEAEAQLAKALAEEQERQRQLEAQKAKDLVNAAKYDFRAEALPNSFVDIAGRIRCEFDRKLFETNLLQQAFAVTGASTAASSSTSTDSSSISLQPVLEILCLRSHKCMVSPPVWNQILQGEKEDAAKQSQGQKKMNENIVRIGDNVWLVAERIDPTRVHILSGHIEAEFADVLIKIEKLCHNEYLRPILIRLIGKRFDASPIILGEFSTNLRLLETCVVGNKSLTDPNGPVRTEESPFDLLSSSQSIVGNCLFTRAQELIYEPYDKLLEKMEAKRRKANSSISSLPDFKDSHGPLLFPKHCKMQLILRCGNLVNLDGSLHTFCVLYRSSSSSDLDGDEAPLDPNDPFPSKKQFRASRQSSTTDLSAITAANTSQPSQQPPLTPNSMVQFNSKTWTELTRTNLLSYNEFPEFSRITLELDQLRCKLKASIFVICYCAGYLGVDRKTSDLSLSDIQLDRCTIIGAAQTNLQQLCGATGTVTSSTPAASTRKLDSEKDSKKSTSHSSDKDGKKKKKAKHSSMELDANKLLSLDMDDADGEIQLLRSSLATTSSSTGSTRTSAVTLPQTICPDGTFTFSSVSVFSPSTQLEDVEKAEAKRVKKLAKLSEQAAAAARAASEDEAKRVEEEQRVRQEIAIKRGELATANNNTESAAYSVAVHLPTDIASTKPVPLNEEELPLYQVEQ